MGETYEQEEKSIYPYCTELIVNKDAGGKGHDPLTLRAFLESLGDCVLVADDTDFIKVHCHTDHPGKVIEEALNFGFLTDIKIDNMRIQSQQKSDTPIKQMGFVAVASGEGICETFKDLGVDAVVEGGQTMNPSTEDILRAIESVPAQTVFVLPNNKNIIMAAEQAASLSGGKGRVLHTKTVPQGMSAMLAYLPNASVDENMLAMEGASRQVHTGMITYAVRNMDFGGKHIRVNETLALADGQLAFTDSDMVRAAEKLLKQMVDRSTAFITILYGEGASAKQAEYLHTRISAKYPKAEVNIINGGQPLYRFILSVE